MANPQNFRIGGNDEHGLNPPTTGKRTPVMPYIGRSFYEAEFNRPAKQYFLAALARLGFRVYDVKPEAQDVSVSTRVVRVNRAGLNCVVTFAYNATSQPGFNSSGGSQVYYSQNNRYPSASRDISELIAQSIASQNVLRNRGIAPLSGVGMLSSVNCAASLVEAGFMTNFREAKLMLDPEFQNLIAESTAKALCSYYDVVYTPQPSGANYPLLRRGDRGQYVLYLQWMLLVFGYAAATPDGIFGPATEQSVRNFQTKNGLSSDGVVGRRTWMTLMTDFSDAPILRTGSTGIYVRYLQQKLFSKLYPVAIDGVFGPGTLSAVLAFQREKGLSADGIVGARTWQAATTLNEGRPLP